MNHLLGLRCTVCGATYARDELDYVCPHHGDEGIVDAIYDYAAIAAATSPAVLSASREMSMWRYRDLLRELSQTTQFVVVTHNRNTVQAADVIYGVTM